MMEVQHTQTVQAEMEYLLTREAYIKWTLANFLKIALSPEDGLTVPEFYLKEHGLPLDSQIKGL